MSNGGFFSSSLACKLTDRIAAIAVVAATMGEGEPEQCSPSRPISVLYMHGSKDPIVPIDGGAVLKTRGRCVSQDAAVRVWRDFDRTGARTDVPSPAGVHRTQYSGGKDGTEVVKYVVDGAGQVWPGGPQYLPAFIIGHATNAISGQ
jgi:polyhydroxybutyrate depolymerase